MDLALAAARAAVPVGALVRERLSEALAAGDGDKDLSALAEVSRRHGPLPDDG